MDEWVSQLPPQSVWMGLGLLVAVALCALLAGRLRLGRLNTLSLLAACVVGGGLGSRLAWLLLDPKLEWTDISSNTLVILDPVASGHSSFGAMLGGGLTLGLWWMLKGDDKGLSSTLGGSRRRATLYTLDTLAVSALAGLGLARLGCLANGCDFGRVSEGIWALRYAPGTEAFGHHLMTHRIGWDAQWSLPVHPFALYLALGTFGIVLAGAWVLWARNAQPGQVAGWSCMSYLLLRFVAEWTRDPVTVLQVWGAFNIHHLLAVGGAVGCGVALVFHARLGGLDGAPLDDV